MIHLSPDQMLEIAEGAGGGQAAAHLASCIECQRQVAEVRSVMAMVSASAGDVPEPSPLFWDHFSSRVHDLVAAETNERRRWPFAGWLAPVAGTWSRAGAVSAVAAAVLIAAVMIATRPARHPQEPAGVVAAADATAVADASVPMDDPSFGIVSDLAADIDVETAMAAGLASAGSADHAVFHMTGAELMELERLLQDQASSGGKS